jgi:Histidine phosphatase superfamily (branch 1)
MSMTHDEMAFPADRRLAERLRGLIFAKVFTSPLVRAARTCELAGWGSSRGPVDTSS